MKALSIVLSAALLAGSASLAGASPVYSDWTAQYAPLTKPMMPSYTKKRHKHVYYGIGGAKHQTATGGPAGGITSRN